MKYKLTEAEIREDLDMLIEVVEEVLSRVLPPSVRECLLLETVLFFGRTYFPADPEALRRLLERLRCLRESPPELQAVSLASAMVGLEPVIVQFPASEELWTGTMASAMTGLALGIFGEAPVVIPVRGADGSEAERKIAWLLGQLGVPHEAAEARVA